MKIEIDNFNSEIFGMKMGNPGFENSDEDV